MEKRYQVFVSSTYEDLREARQEVMQALLELDCIPAGMELFPAANDDQWTLIQGVIDDCDYYIVIVGGRYGSLGPNDRSYTEMEYDYAVAKGKPVIGFLHKQPGELPQSKCERSADGRARLESFRDKLQKKMCRFWTSPSDLGSVVSRSLIKLIKTNPAIGWVRADLLPDSSIAEEALRLRKRIEELEEQLRQGSGNSPGDIERLSQGDDAISVHYRFDIHKPQSYRAEATYRSSIDVTWNELFAAISPLLIDEASDISVRNALDGFIGERARHFHEADREFKGLEIRKLSIIDEDFQTIKVQFLALDLMCKSTKKKSRSVSDRNAYWMLTRRGEAVMTSLRAIRKHDAKSVRPARKKRRNK